MTNNSQPPPSGWAEFDHQPGLEVRPEPEGPEVVPGQVLPGDEYYNKGDQAPPPPPSKEQQAYGGYSNGANYPYGGGGGDYSPQQQHQQAMYQQQYPQQPQPQQGYFHNNSGSYHAGSPATATATSTNFPDGSGYYGGTSNHELAAGVQSGGRQKRICGLPRRKFCIIFMPLMVLLVIGIAVGLGVGLGTSSNSSSSPSSNSSPTPSAAPTPLSCPAANGTVYTSGDLQDSYQVLCSLDYNSSGGSTDVASQVSGNAEGCAAACDARSDCAGAGWGSTGGASTCYMKGSLGTSNSAVDGWFFLVRQR